LFFDRSSFHAHEDFPQDDLMLASRVDVGVGVEGGGVNGEHMADFQPKMLVVSLLVVGVVISLLLHRVEGLLCI
jgi:hypothetical protein